MIQGDEIIQLETYVQLAQLDLDGDRLNQPVTAHIQAFLAAAHENIQTKREDRLYCYEVPKITSNGACSILSTPDPETYDLTDIIGGRSQRTTRKLGILNTMVDSAVVAMSVDWLGIYQSRTKEDSSRVLVKLAYWGAMSRAEFPLTEEFAAQSNNSTVGISGTAKIINDIPQYVESGGPYYNCDSRVKAEACMPLFSRETGHIVGIIDAEAWRTGFFSDQTLAPLLALCMVVPEFLI